MAFASQQALEDVLEAAKTIIERGEDMEQLGLTSEEEKIVLDELSPWMGRRRFLAKYGVEEE